MGIQGAVGHEFLVTYPDSIKKELLVPGARVALNQKKLGVVSVFPAKKVEPPRLLRRRGFANLKKKHVMFF